MKYTFKEIDSCNMCGGEGRVLGRRLNQAQGLRPKTRIGITTTVMKCHDCGLLYANPLPIPENIGDHYGIPPESYWNNGYFTVPENHMSDVFRQMFRVCPHAKTFLDVGAGIGRNMRAAEREGLAAWGVEPSEPFYSRALERMGIASERIQNAPVEGANFPRMFDMISFAAVLEHLYDPSACLEKALSWLNPGGVIHLEVPDAGYLFSKIFNAYFWLARTDFVVNISPMHVPFHLYEFTRRSFELNGERLGYEIAHLERYAGTMMAAPRLTRFFGPLMNATSTGEGLVVYLRKI